MDKDILRQIIIDELQHYVDWKDNGECREYEDIDEEKAAEITNEIIEHYDDQLERKQKRLRYKWFWDVAEQGWNLRASEMSRSHATVWPDGTWHTWDKDGVGGYNGVYEFAKYSPRYESIAFAAKREAWKACVEQGFI